jgi:hypothetical protein
MFMLQNPDAYICSCGEPRRMFFNAVGLHIWRCPGCELQDILAYLRREYGWRTSVQFRRNMGMETVN